MEQKRRSVTELLNENDSGQARRAKQQAGRINDPSVDSDVSIYSRPPLSSRRVSGGLRVPTVKLEGGRTRICDLSALELKRLCEFPAVQDLEQSMETLARVAFYVKDDEAKLRRILKAIKTLQDVMSEDC